MTAAVHDATAGTSAGGTYANPLRLIDWIWRIRGALEIAPGQSGDEVFDRLDPLFRERNTSHERQGDVLTFRKKDQDAQDKMSIFDDGALWIDRSGAVPRLRYDLFSRALLFCFLSPLLFLAFAQGAIALGKYEKAREAAESKKEEKDKDKPEIRLNPIDKFLGAPEPEKADKKKDEEKDEDPYSPTAAYVFAGLFAALYVVGRLLEAVLIRRQFRKALSGG